jgi:hypothetical protein
LNNSKNIKSNLVIFIRQFNDFDMILPFVDYVARKNKNNLILYSDVKSIPGSTYHQDFLRTQHNEKINYLFDAQYFRRFKSILGFHDMILRIQRWDKTNKRVRKVNMPYISYFFSIIIKIIVGLLELILQKPIKKFVDNLNISDKIIGHAGFENGFPFRTIIKLAEKRSIATIGSSRSFTCYTNLDFTGKSSINKDSFSGVDKAKDTMKKIIVNKIRGKRYYCTHYVAGRSQKRAFFQSASFPGFEKPNRVYESCTPRYTKGWCEIFRSYLLERTKFSFGAKEKLNVIFFISDLAYNVNESELINTVFELSKMENINFVYKPHPGSHLSFNKCGANCYDAREINSILLSDWADVGIVFGSSIGVQLLLDNVPLIVPSYVHTNTTIYEEYSVCINTKSLFELKTILSNNNKNDISKLVDNKRVECFLDKYLDGSKGYDQLMLEYYEEVVNMKRFSG